MTRFGQWLLTAAVTGMTLILCGMGIAPRSTSGAEPPNQLSQGSGIAGKYPGDVGIAEHLSVVFVENFEHDSLDDLQKRWESVSQPEILSFSQDTPAASGGKRSLLVRHVGGEGDGAHLYRRLDQGYDRLHVRFYVKFESRGAPIHHFFHVGGYNPATPYPQGGAGQRPRGDDRFSVGLEPYGRSWTWDYYAYWMEMRGSPPRGQTWGNSFLGESKPKVARDSWTCIEAMIAMNDVGDSNGELALWVDGRRVSHLGKGFPAGKWTFDTFHPGKGGESVRWNDARREPERSLLPEGGEPFEGFRWRKDERLKLNFLWLLVYITQAEQGQVTQVWFDDIVVAREYIGPLAER